MWPFTKSKEDDTSLVPRRDELNTMARTLLEVARLDFDSSSQLEQALTATFLFGMIFAHGSTHGMQPHEVHALSLVVFQDTLHYSDAAAAEGVQQAISASTPGYHNTMHAIIHRGIDGHRQYVEGDRAGLGENIQSVLAHFRKNEEG
ncbi:MAG: hypothetical protein KDN18_25655 [Verrucomicrobiae bacterium]|nr:hypothetical protein [Verrucomicrobiae bacterium]